MTSKIVKVLVTTVSLAALILGTAPSMARGGGGHGGGGGHFGGGGGHFGGGGAHFSGAHFSSARMGTSRFSAAHISGRNFSGRNFSGRNFSRVSRGNFARVNGAHVGAAALGTRAAWNHLGQQLERRLEPRMGRLVRTSLLALLYGNLFAFRSGRTVITTHSGLTETVRVGCHVLARSPVRLRPVR